MSYPAHLDQVIQNTIGRTNILLTLGPCYKENNEKMNWKQIFFIA